MNESAGMGAGSVFRTGLIEQVHEGMTVLDASGQKLGTVEYVQMGDPEAATIAGNELEKPGLIGGIAQAVVGDEREPDVSEPLRSQLLRQGFIKVDGPGLTDTDRYVRGDLIRSVAGDNVTVAAAKDQLPKED